MTDRTILLLAAGASRRMGGRDKLLEIVGDQTLILRQALASLAVSSRVAVTLPASDTSRRAALADVWERLEVINVEDADTGMSASFRAAVKHGLRGPVMALPCDMPELSAEHLKTLWCIYEKHDAMIVRGASANGRPGHPVIFPPDLIASFADLSGDQGARSLLLANPDRIIKTPLPGEAALTDLDTLEEWDNWRNSRSD